MKKTMIKLAILTTFVSPMFAQPAFAEVEGVISSGEWLKAAHQRVTDIDTKSLKQLLDSNPGVVLIDVRTPTEIKKMGGAIDAKQNINVPRGWLEFQIENKVKSKDAPIVLYCGGGLRSTLAADTLQKMGYTNVKNYNEGYLSWEKAGLPIK